jgi:hypothetical protein
MYEGNVNQVPMSTSPTPPTRSESLADLFKSFMESDRELHEARESVAVSSVALNDSQMRLANAEKRWSETTQKFVGYMAAEAPPRIQAELQQCEQASFAAAGVGAYGGQLGGSQKQRW